MKISLIIFIFILASLIGCQKESSSSISSEKESLDTQIKSDDNDLTIIPFWPASKKEHRILKQGIVDSQYTTIPGSKLLRLRTELVEATFDIQDVIEQFDKSFKEHPNLKCDKVLAERLRKESDTRSQFLYSEFSGEDNERVRFCIADLLEQGKFIITLRSNNNIVAEIIACEWSNYRGPLDGIGGRVFNIKDGRTFFWTVDWIS